MTTPGSVGAAEKVLVSGNGTGTQVEAQEQEIKFSNNEDYDFVPGQMGICSDGSYQRFEAEQEGRQLEIKKNVNGFKGVAQKTTLDKDVNVVQQLITDGKFVYSNDYAYDKSGRLKSIIVNDQQAAATRSGTVVYDDIQYDDNGRAVSAKSSKNPNFSMTFQYDENGNKVSETRRQEFCTEYDADGKLTYGDAVEIVYDASGKAVRQINESADPGQYIKEKYTNGRLDKKEENGVVSEYSYNKDGTGKCITNGVEEQFTVETQEQNGMRLYTLQKPSGVTEYLIFADNSAY
ncbi:MAG: hypothetical protein LBK53_03735 [Heliobacteriaceae bacterium]|jgi:YD repeat-containing protein|nr:hypothetical protein [Heliobacteriaceae bacterium]